MISKLVNKFYKRNDLEVRADKFVSTYSKLASTEIKSEQKDVQKKVPFIFKLGKNMISKLVNKFYKRDDIEVRADKFVSTYSKLTKSEIQQDEKTTKLKAPPPPPPSPSRMPPPPPKPASDFSDDFASVFSGKTLQTASSQTGIANDANFLDDYYKDVIMPVLNNIKEELFKYGKEVTYTMNKTLNISSLSVNYQGRNEYDYIIQIKKGATASSSILTLKESGQRGGYDVRETLTNMKLNQVSKADFIKDFLAGYRKFAVSKGWMKL